ncbi:MAG: ISL3 family transposase [Bacilli bacterium]|nr:ISL3 family transposase [Bacilli bacterium]
MDFNTFFIRFGFDSSNFVNKPPEIIETNDGYIYEVEEEYRQRICPFCNHQHLQIHDYKWIKINLSSTKGIKETLRIKRIRYKCSRCYKTHTFKLDGIERNRLISDFVKTAIQNEFYEIQSFSTIADRYDVSLNQVINIFDEYTKKMPRRPLPEYLCIDEKHFEGDTDGKYAVIISDFFTGDVIDVLENRQMPYLDEYFKNISFKERSDVKVFISDMYDGYSTIKNRYFPKAMFVVDLFHVVKLLTSAVNKIRIRTYNQIAIEDTLERHFMKTNWRYFLMDYMKIYEKEYHSKKFDTYINFGEIIVRCLKMNIVFWDGYNVLQELLHYDKYETYTESERFMNRIIAKLNSSGDELLEKVAESYKRWKVGIIHGLARNQTRKRFSNAIAENNNSHIQRVINVAYGYRNFKRFRSRIMLILTYKNQR